MNTSQLKSILFLTLATQLIFPAPILSTDKADTLTLNPASTSVNLVSILTSDKDQYKSSDHIIVRLVMKNSSGLTLTYDDQQVDVNNPFKIINPTGHELSYNKNSVMTVGRSKKIEPNETVVLLDKYDLTESYSIFDPGRYIIVHRGLDCGDPPDVAIPPSNQLEIEVLK